MATRHFRVHGDLRERNIVCYIRGTCIIGLTHTPVVVFNFYSHHLIIMYFMFRIVQEDDTHNVVPKIRQLNNSIGFAPPHRCPTNNSDLSLWLSDNTTDFKVINAYLTNIDLQSQKKPVVTLIFPQKCVSLVTSSFMITMHFCASWKTSEIIAFIGCLN